MRTAPRQLQFAIAAGRYWALAFPHARRAVRRCMHEAAAIPDGDLRAAALGTLTTQQGNLEGAAAFAAFAPRQHRASLVEALVAFQATYDFVDTLAEQPSRDAAANARATHQALLAALTPGGGRPDCYAHARRGADGGYLDRLVDRCRDALATLPSQRTVQPALTRAVERMIDYQVLIHADAGDARAECALAAWALRETPTASGLRWWETAAGGASSLVAFALIAAAAQPRLSARETRAIEAAYFPWIGSLHVLLDSLVDWPHDVATGHRSLVAQYACDGEAAARMQAIGHAALRCASALPRAAEHELLLAAMAGFYLAQPAARLPHAAATTAGLTAELEERVAPILWVHRARQRLCVMSRVRP